MTEFKLKCDAPLPDGGLCDKVDCTDHRKLPVPAKSHYTPTVWQLLDQMKDDFSLDEIDGEVALLAQKIDEIDKDTALRQKEKYDLLLRYAKELADTKIKRHRLLAEQEFLIHRSKLKKLLLDVYLIICRYVKTDAERAKASADLERIDLSAHRAQKMLEHD